jgi:hypothetical protein
MINMNRHGNSKYVYGMVNRTDVVGGQHAKWTRKEDARDEEGNGIYGTGKWQRGIFYRTRFVTSLQDMDQTTSNRSKNTATETKHASWMYQNQSENWTERSSVCLCGV